MGCDIHVHVEIKVGGKWLHYNHPRVGRNYLLFAILANVRNYSGGWHVEPIAMPKGLPDELSDTTRLDFGRDEPDAHSMSWLSSEELAKLEDFYDNDPRMAKRRDIIHGLEGEFGYLFGNSLAGFHKYPSDNPPFLEDVRVVFWFDN